MQVVDWLYVCKTSLWCLKISQDFLFLLCFQKLKMPHNLHVHFLLCLLRLSRAGKSQEDTYFSWYREKKRWFRWSLAIRRLRCLSRKFPSGKLVSVSVLVFPVFFFFLLWGWIFLVSHVLQTWTEVSSTPGALVSMLLRLPKLKFVIVTSGEHGCLMVQRASKGTKPKTLSLSLGFKTSTWSFPRFINIIWLCRLQQKYLNLKRQTLKACWRHWSIEKTQRQHFQHVFHRYLCVLAPKRNFHRMKTNLPFTHIFSCRRQQSWRPTG